MIQRLIARFRRVEEPESPPEPEDEGEDAFLKSLLDSSPGAGPRRQLPTYLETERRSAESRRPYLDLSRDELARYATLKTEPKGRAVQDQVSDGVGRLIDRTVLAPMRDLASNFGFLVTGALVIGATIVTAWVLIELARWMFRPLGV